MALLKKILAKNEKPAKTPARNNRAAQSDTASQTERAPAGAGSHAAASVLVRPHMTEKTSSSASAGVYVFAVAQGANKHAVALAVEARYGVKVARVRMTRTHEKARRRGQLVGWKPGIKKAIVALAEGNKIETL